MPTSNYIVKNKTTSDISAEELQEALSKAWGFVVVEGNQEDWLDRRGKLQMETIRGFFKISEMRFVKGTWTERFIVEQILVEKVAYTYFYKSDRRISEEEVRQFVQGEMGQKGGIVLFPNLHGYLWNVLPRLLEKPGEGIQIKVDNNGQNENRASKVCAGTVCEFLGSKENGMNLCQQMTVKPLELEMKYVRTIISLDGLKCNGHVFYCGGSLGVMGVSARCGPNNGPSCRKCMIRQSQLHDAMEIHVSVDCRASATITTMSISTAAVDMPRDQADSTERSTKTKRACSGIV